MRATCVFAVASLMTRREQISGFDNPAAFNFDKRDYFKVEESAAREAPKVSFS